jgi:succinoglycan biosynthesis protein ExoM
MPMAEHVCVCILTFHRNELLARLLRGIALQVTEGEFTVGVLVVDNDRGGSARETVTEASTRLGLSTRYVIEEEQSIPAARNRALREADGSLVAFIDDDEFPAVTWLLTLVRALRTFDADGCLGPVHPFFLAPPPAWLVPSGLCERPVIRTGTVLGWDQTRTGNVLMRRESAASRGLLFDTTYTAGSSDKEFFKRAMAAGGRFVAVAEAPVYEVVPPERWSLRYYLRRALIHGYTTHRTRRSVSGPGARAAAFAASGVIVGATIVGLPLLLLAGIPATARRLVSAAHHCSRMCATLGIQLVKTRGM